jgi:hypothetical protein
MQFNKFKNYKLQSSQVQPNLLSLSAAAILPSLFRIQKVDGYVNMKILLNHLIASLVNCFVLK